MSSLKAAVRLEFISRNVAESVRPESKSDRWEIAVWTPEEVVKFLNMQRTDRLYAAFYIMLCLGLRRGEILGLRWQDVDLGAGILTVRQTFGKGAKGRPRFSIPKTPKSYRTLSLPDDVTVILQQHKEQQENESEAAKEAWQESDLIFTTGVGTFIHPDNLKHPFKQVCKQAGVTLISLHGLRHTYTSLARQLRS